MGWFKAMSAAIKGAQAGVNAWGNASRQKISAKTQSKMSAISAEQVRTGMRTQELDNQNAMDDLARLRQEKIS